MKLYILNINNLIEEEYTKYYSLLSPAKKERIDKYKRLKDKQLSVAGEMLVKEHISELYNTPVESIEILTNEQGKPYINNSDVQFNISHKGDIAVCAVDDESVGVDIEIINPTSLKAALFAFSSEEIEFIFGKTPCENNFEYCEDYSILEKFFRIWTIKEAFCKCTGKGIKDIKTVDALKFLDCATVHNGEYCIAVITDKDIKKSLCTD